MSTGKVTGVTKARRAHSSGSCGTLWHTLLGLLNPENMGVGGTTFLVNVLIYQPTRSNGPVNSKHCCENPNSRMYVCLFVAFSSSVILVVAYV